MSHQHSKTATRAWTLVSRMIQRCNGRDPPRMMTLSPCPCGVRWNTKMAARPRQNGCNCRSELRTHARARRVGRCEIAYKRWDVGAINKAEATKNKKQQIQRPVHAVYIIYSVRSKNPIDLQQSKHNFQHGSITWTFDILVQWDCDHGC